MPAYRRTLPLGSETHQRRSCGQALEERGDGNGVTGQHQTGAEVVQGLQHKAPLGQARVG
ncbi:MAG: hypothetical protein ABI883_04495 [Chthoniobacterales bacterium]